MHLLLIIMWCLWFLLIFMFPPPPSPLSASHDENRKELLAVLDVSGHCSFLKHNASLPVSLFIDQCLKKQGLFNRPAAGLRYVQDSHSLHMNPNNVFVLFNKKSRVHLMLFISILLPSRYSDMSCTFDWLSLMNFSHKNSRYNLLFFPIHRAEIYHLSFYQIWACLFIHHQFLK